MSYWTVILRVIWIQTYSYISGTNRDPLLCYQGNKGGVSVRLDFYGVNLIFVNSHFQAHMENYADRIEVRFSK